MDGEHPQLNATLERDLAQLQEGARRWPALRLTEQIALLEGCRRATGRVAAAWTAAAAALKGVAGSPLAGEEGFTGPWALLVALRGYRDTLAEIERCGGPRVDPKSLRLRDDGQLVVRVFPAGAADALLLRGVSGEVWMQPGVTPESLPQTMGLADRAADRDAGLCLVLGAGNVSSIGPLDVLYQLVAHGRTCLLKVHPLLESLGPFFEAALAPLAAAGFVRFAYGGAQAGRELCAHPAIARIHVTGSRSTFEAIVANLPQPKPVSGELGNVSPTIVVPGSWSAADLRYQAAQIATAKLHNDGFNCVALQVLILPERWPLRERFVAEIHRAVREGRDRIAYYPGAAQRYAELTRGRAAARYGRDDAGFLARTIVETQACDLDDALFAREVFAPVLAIVALPGDRNAYLRSAVDFANERLTGNLAANLVVDARTLRADAKAVDEAVAALRYGCVGVNAWSGVAFLLANLPWGAYPDDSNERSGSGTGVVHNARLFKRPQKAVLRAPFAPFPRRLRPPWLISHRNQAKIAAALCEFELAPAARKLAKIAYLTLTG